MADDVSLAGLSAKLNGLMFEPFIRSAEAMAGMAQISMRLGQAMADATIGSTEAGRRWLESWREVQKAPLDVASALTELGTANARLLVRTAEAVQAAVFGRSGGPLAEPLTGPGRR